MKAFACVALVSALGVPLLAVDVRAQARDVAFDFRMTDSGTVTPKPGRSIGRAVVSKGRVRMDVKGTSRTLAMPGAAPGDDITIIMPDEDKTIIYINPKRKQYMQFNAKEAMDRTQKMMEGMGATIKFELTRDPKFEHIGPGPVILGHKTQHYRMTAGMRMTTRMIGESMTMETLSVSDTYLAPDLHGMSEPFRHMGVAIPMGMLGAANKAYLERLKAAHKKRPRGFELRATTQVSVIGEGRTQSTTTLREITAIRRTTASEDQFVVPPAFTRVDLPLGLGAGKIPPE